MPISLTERANEGSTYVVQVDFVDEEGTATTPVTCQWTLFDGSLNVINNRNDVALTPDTTMYIVLHGDDLALTSEADNVRYLHVEATYNSNLGVGLEYEEELVFSIDPLKDVPDATA